MKLSLLADDLQLWIDHAQLSYDIYFRERRSLFVELSSLLMTRDQAAAHAEAARVAKGLQRAPRVVEIQRDHFISIKTFCLNRNDNISNEARLAFETSLFALQAGLD